LSKAEELPSVHRGWPLPIRPGAPRTTTSATKLLGWTTPLPISRPYWVQFQQVNPSAVLL